MSISAKIQENRNALVNKIIKDIQDHKPFFWDSGIVYGAMPRKLVQALKGNNDFYKGVNHLHLSISALEKGFKDSRWATFKQAQDLGFKIKKGSKGTTIEFYQDRIDEYKINPQTGKKEPVYVIDEETGQKVKQQIKLDYPIIKTYTVFNAEQMEGIELEKPENIKINPDDINFNMENMIKNSEAKVYFDQSTRNFYRPSTDEIHVVPKEGFKSLDMFYATVAHEIAHSTGAKHRLNRKTLVENDGFGNITYAKEELRAELTSMFLAQKYNIKFDQRHYENHAAYLQSWVKILQDDPNELFKAASEAEKAVQYIETNMIGLKQEQTLSNNENKIDTNKLTIIQSFKPKANSISTTQLYLRIAQNLLKEHDDIWQQDFNKKIVSELQNKGKNVFDIKQAIMKYSPVNMPAEVKENIPQNINQETNNIQLEPQNITMNTNKPITETEATEFAQKLEQIIYYNPNSNDLNPIENAYFSLYQKAIAVYKNNLQNMEFPQIDYKIAKTLLNKDFSEEDIFKVIKENSPINWQDEKLKQICIKKQQETQKNEAFFEEYARRLEAIQYVLIEDKPYTPVEKAYLETYHDMIAHIDIENTPYKDAINKNLEKNVMQTLLEKNFKTDEIFPVIEKYSPLQLEVEEIQNILNPKQTKQDIQDVEEQLDTKNLATEPLYTKDDIKNSMNEHQGNNEAIQKSIFIKIQMTYDSFVRLNRIRNFPEFVAKLSDDPKYLYLKEASKLRQLQVQNRILSNRAEIELYQKSNNDLIIASRLLEKGHTDEEIASLMVKYSPLKPSIKEINLTLKNAHILSNMEKLAQMKVEDVAIKNIAEEYILTCKKVIVDNMNNNILWNKDSESKVIKELINKGFKQDKIIPVITKFSPAKISSEEAKNLVMNTLGQGNIELSLQEFLSQNLKNKHTSEVKIVEDALKRNFPELQNKKSITKKRNFIQNELKKIKKQTQKLTR